MSEYNEERSRELAEILLAEANGEKIEHSMNRLNWYDVRYGVLKEINDDYGGWVSEELFFRVKPKPKVIAFCVTHGVNNAHNVTPRCVVCDDTLFKFYEKDQIQEGQ
jgi:hypothetical protein